MPTPEALARQNINAQLTACGWVVQNRAALHLYAGRGVAVREFPLETGYADYLLFVDRRAAGVVEAKAEGVPQAGVAEQAAAYAAGLPANIPHVDDPLPFLTRASAWSVNPTFISKQTHSGELARSKVLPGDVLMNIVGPPLGKVSIVPDTYPQRWTRRWRRG